MKRHQVQASAASLAAIFVSYGALAQQAAVGVGAKANAAAATPAPAAAAPAPEPPPPPPPPPAADPAPAPANNQAGMALPANANAATNNSDHDEMVGHIAVGYLGRSTIPVGGYDPATQNIRLAAPVPVIGVRYWLNPQLGLDLGAGLWIGKRSTDTTPAGGATVTANGPKPTAFVVHAGVPLSLASAKHFSFQIIPEMNFGYAKVSQDASPTSMSGTHFDIGARAGAEIHFGFMGIPQLSLIGSVGLLFQYDKMNYETPAAAPATGSNVVSTGEWTLGTTVNDNPWNIFVTNVGALYYF